MGKKTGAENKQEVPLLQRIERQALQEGQEWIKNRMKTLVAEEEEKQRQLTGEKKRRRKEDHD